MVSGWIIGGVPPGLCSDVIVSLNYIEMRKIHPMSLWLGISPSLALPVPLGVAPGVHANRVGRCQLRGVMSVSRLDTEFTALAAYTEITSSPGGIVASLLSFGPPRWAFFCALVLQRHVTNRSVHAPPYGKGVFPVDSRITSSLARHLSSIGFPIYVAHGRSCLLYCEAKGRVATNCGNSPDNYKASPTSKQTANYLRSQKISGRPDGRQTSSLNVKTPASRHWSLPRPARSYEQTASPA
jgi:hypothetical protein